MQPRCTHGVKWPRLLNILQEAVVMFTNTGVSLEVLNTRNTHSKYEYCILYRPKLQALLKFADRHTCTNKQTERPKTAYPKHSILVKNFLQTFTAILSQILLHTVWISKI